MRAARQPSQHILGTDYCECEAFQRAIDCGGDHQAGRLYHGRAGCDERVQVGDMLNHLHRQHDIKALVRSGQFFRRRCAIVDRNARILSMRTSGIDIFLRWVDANDFRAQPRKRLRQDATAASDIQKAHSLETVELLGIAIKAGGGLVADVGKTDGIELMQRGHRPARIPPIRSETRETLDLGLIDRRRVTSICHNSLRSSRPQRVVTCFRNSSGASILCSGSMPTPVPRIVMSPQLSIRPSIDWSTSTLSTLSMFISTVCRRIKPRLYTIRLSVDFRCPARAEGQTKTKQHA